MRVMRGEEYDGGSDRKHKRKSDNSFKGKSPFAHGGSVGVVESSSRSDKPMNMGSSVPPSDNNDNIEELAPMNFQKSVLCSRMSMELDRGALKVHLGP
jgi:hypothetical protein